MRTVLVAALATLVLAGCSSCEEEAKAPAPAARAPESEEAPARESADPMEQARQQARKQMAEDLPDIHIDSPRSIAGKPPRTGRLQPAKPTRFADQVLLEGARGFAPAREKTREQSVTLERAEQAQPSEPPSPGAAAASDTP